VTDDDHLTCDDESCEICKERERQVAREINPGIDRVMRDLKPHVARRRRRPQA
jgi:hypothetical protein